jgi:hypothetical protein
VQLDAFTDPLKNIHVDLLSSMSCHQIHKLQRFQQQFQASKSVVARESTVNKCGNVQHQDESYQNKMVETFGTQHEYEEREDCFEMRDCKKYRMGLTRTSPNSSFLFNDGFGHFLF